MNCEQIERWISADQDGELDPRQRRLLHEHLACCAECRALRGEWAELAQELRATLTRTEAPPALHGRVMRHLPAPARAPARAGRAGFWQPQASLSLALVPLAAAAVWLLLAPRLPRPSPWAAVPAGPKVVTTASLPSLAAVEPGATGHRAAPGHGARPEVKRRNEKRAKAMESSHTGPARAAAPRAKRRPERARPLTEWQRQFRELRRGRRRYPIAMLPRREERRRRAPERLARRVEPVAPRPAPARAPAPRIAIVDYVLPQLVPQAPAADGGAEWVLPPADPDPAQDTGVAL